MSFSAEEKLEIIMEALKSDKSKKSVAENHGISRQTLHEWEKKLKQGAKDTLADKKAGRKKEDEPESLDEAKKELDDLKQQKQELEEKLEQAKKEKELQEIKFDFFKYSLTEDESRDPELREKNIEILKKRGILPDKNDES